MPKKSGIILITLGAVLILAALLLFLHNRDEDRRAGQEAESLLEDVRSAMAAHTDPKPQDTPDEAVTYDYAGVIAIPDLSLELPVIDQWDYDRLKTAPCRQSGTAAGGDLVIAAHNYKSHFGYLDRLQPGASVVFTDMEGTVYRYAAEDIRQLEPGNEEDVSSVFSSEYPLVLYTCTPGGKARVAVFCQWDETTE